MDMARFNLPNNSNQNGFREHSDEAKFLSKSFETFAIQLQQVRSDRQYAILQGKQTKQFLAPFRSRACVRFGISVKIDAAAAAESDQNRVFPLPEFRCC